MPSQKDTTAIATGRLPQSAITTDRLPRTETILIDQEQFRTLFADFCRVKGRKAELARRWGVSGQFIGDVIAGKKRPGKKLLAGLDARPVLMIEIAVGGEFFEGDADG